MSCAQGADRARDTGGAEETSVGICMDIQMWPYGEAAAMTEESWLPTCRTQTHTHASVTGLLEGQHPGPLAGAADLGQSTA